VAYSCCPLVAQFDYFGASLPYFLYCCFHLDPICQKRTFDDFGCLVSMRPSWRVVLNEFFHPASARLLTVGFLEGALILHWDEK
jgi:hypothetical protein